jgi:hypothetical protein
MGMDEELLGVAIRLLRRHVPRLLPAIFDLAHWVLVAAVRPVAFLLVAGTPAVTIYVFLRDYPSVLRWAYGFYAAGVMVTLVGMIVHRRRKQLRIVDLEDAGGDFLVALLWPVFAIVGMVLAPSLLYERIVNKR